jgi:hypothetical protein
MRVKLLEKLFGPPAAPIAEPDVATQLRNREDFLLSEIHRLGDELNQNHAAVVQFRKEKTLFTRDGTAFVADSGAERAALEWHWNELLRAASDICNRRALVLDEWATLHEARKKNA